MLWIPANSCWPQNMDDICWGLLFLWAFVVGITVNLDIANRHITPTAGLEQIQWDQIFAFCVSVIRSKMSHHWETEKQLGSWLSGGDSRTLAMLNNLSTLLPEHFLTSSGPINDQKLYDYLFGSNMQGDSWVLTHSVLDQYVPWCTAVAKYLK